MRALTFDGSSVRLETARTAVPAHDGDAAIRLIKAAVSNLDVEIARGLMSFRGVLGHQFVGAVESVSGHTPTKITGKRVVGSIVVVCGKCDMCLSGLSAHCRSRSIMGMLNRDGCLADRFVLPAKNLVVVPDAVDNDQAVFAVELAQALQTAAQLTIAGKPYITVIGDGSLALLTGQVMAKLNASVRLVGDDLGKLEVCEKWGLKHRPMNDVGRRADQDIVVECTGTSEGLALATQLVRPRGKVVLKSAPATGLAATRLGQSFDLQAVLLNEIEVIGSFCGPIAEAVAMLSRREVDVVSLISKRMSLNDGPALLRAATQPGVIKVLVDP
ncbi:MAG: alcohol dehydrogenase catalytic domain-containing protein [Phycisphaerales bacterium]|nr:alcohol dehydrogenase catalytic domain-containing protein [Phycisphaerales bacterium]